MKGSKDRKELWVRIGAVTFEHVPLLLTVDSAEHSGICLFICHKEMAQTSLSQVPDPDPGNINTLAQGRGLRKELGPAWPLFLGNTVFITMALLQSQHIAATSTLPHAAVFAPVRTVFASLHVHTAVIYKLHRTQAFHIFIHTKILQGRREERKRRPSGTLG